MVRVAARLLCTQPAAAVLEPLKLVIQLVELRLNSLARVSLARGRILRPPHGLAALAARGVDRGIEGILQLGNAPLQALRLLLRLCLPRRGALSLGCHFPL